MRVLQGILLSLFLHFFLAWSAQFAPVLASRLENDPITVEIVEEEKSQNETFDQARQMVRQTEVPEDLKTEESEDSLAFLSERTQRVKKQMQAAQSGMTQNRSSTAAEASRSSQEQASREETSREKQSNNEQTKPDPDGLEAFTPQYRTSPLPQPSRDLARENGFSTIGEALPNDVAVGSFTALNTDRYLYYSFFARIEELIRFRWETSVRLAIDSSPPERLASNPSGIWTTHLEIWLKRNGELDSTHIMKESGMRSFDRAAVQAFVQSRMFPNPPEEMVESDGLIRLKYSFQVRYEPKVLVKSRE